MVNLLAILCLSYQAYTQYITAVTTDQSDPGETYHAGSVAGGTTLYFTVSDYTLMGTTVTLTVDGLFATVDEYTMRDYYFQATTPAARNPLGASDLLMEVFIDGIPATFNTDYQFTYSLDNTPNVYWIAPSQDSTGGFIQLYGDWKTNDIDNFNYLYLNSKLVVIPEDLTISSSIDFIYAQLGDNTAGDSDFNVTVGLNYGNSTFRWTAYQYTIDGTPYLFKALANITSISSDQSSSDGGLSIEIEGFGFPNNTASVSISIEGNPCNVTASSLNSISCTTSSYTSTLPGPLYPGNSGLRRELWYGYSFYQQTTVLALTPNLTEIVPCPETFENSGVNFVERLSGFFLAPRTGNYVFYISSDDSSAVYLSTDSTPGNMVQINGLQGWTDYRDFFTSTSQTSNKTALTAGNLYYMEIWHEQGSGNAFITLGLEVDAAPSTSNNNVPDIQQLLIQPTVIVREVQSVEISGVPSGSVTFNYNGNTASVDLSVNGTTNNAGILNTLQGLTGAACVANETQVTSSSNSLLRYDCTFNSAPTGPRNIIATGNMQVSYFQAVPPSPPLNGTYDLSWVDQNGNTVQTNQSFSVSTSAWTIQSTLNTKYSIFQNELIVTGSANGDQVSLVFTFGGPLNGGSVSNVQLLNPALTGGQNGQVNVTISKILQSSANQFWYLAPNEFFRTAETSPQLVVQVNGDPVLCSGNCSFQYLVNSSPSITAVTSSTDTLTLTGLNLVSSTDLVQVTLGGANCPVTAATTTSVTCTLPEGAVGTWSPVVLVDGVGYATIGSGTNQYTYNLAVTGVSPATGPSCGGTVLTITGTGFLPSLNSPLASQTVTVGGSNCTVLTSTSTQITCVTSSQGTGNTLNVAVGTATASSSAFTYNSATSPTITSVTPDYASTIVTTELTLTGTDLGSLTSDPVTVTIGSVECYVLSATATQITCELNGGPTGIWDIVVTIPGGCSPVYPNYPLSYSVTSISPTTGSTQGGTLLTIVGQGFSSLPDQTLIQFYDSSTCSIVGTPTAEQIQCITPPQGSGPSTVTVNVLGRLQENAYCASCDFTYSTASTPSVTSISPVSGFYGQSLTVQGSGFGTDLSQVTVNIGANAAITSITDSQIIATVPYYTAGSVAVTVTVNNLGIASGSFNFTYNLNVASVSPSSISQAGAYLTLTGAGFNADAVVTVGSLPCSISAVTVSQVTCRVARSTSTTAQLISVSQDGNTFACSSASSCGVTFQQSLTPQLTSATLTTDQSSLTVAGTGFSTNSAATHVLIGGVACTVTSATATEVVCTPQLASGTLLVELYIDGQGFASGPAYVVGLFTVDSTTISSSYGGNATLSLTGNGLSPSVNVTVCDLPCQVTSASYTSLSCLTPVLVTTTTESLYSQVTLTNPVTSGLTSTAPANGFELGSAFDNNSTTYYKASSEPCFIGLNAGVGRVIQFGGATLYPSQASPQIYQSLEGSAIQYSDDGSTWTNLTTFSSLVSGWNYYRIPPSTEYAHQYFRFLGALGSSCRIAEFSFLGANLLVSSSTSDTCPVTVNNGTTSLTNAATVTYSQASTPVVQSISPWFATVAGGTTLTFTGTNLSSVTSISIDGVSCSSISQLNSTALTCTTGQKVDRTNTSGLVVLSSTGLAVTSEAVFFYGDKWSSSTTWNGEVPPKDGESVSIPAGMTIILDTNTTMLQLIEIEGSLIALDESDLTLDAYWIFIKGGLLQIGTEDTPFTHQFTLTLHGDRSTPEIPIFGNKVIANYQGVLELHGNPVANTWTSLESPIAVGANSLTVFDDISDWSIGSQIVVASTSFDHTEAETRYIVSISGKTITVDTPFANLHEAFTTPYGSEAIDIRAEVGLLSRNILIQGDPEVALIEHHGVTIMNYSPGDETTQARLSYIEVYNAGQESAKGRYPIHFHMIGTVHLSYVKGCAVHNTYNRAITIHGVHYLSIIDNVTFFTRGHTIFVEDAIETYNVVQHNLVVSVYRTWSLLNTDTSPAGMWVTHPNNFFINNTVAGSDAYGFWFDLQPHPTGPSATNSICPPGEVLGAFSGNTAHSVLRYGLRIFHIHIPVTYPCLNYINETAADPWIDNPSIPAIYENFTAYRCTEDGAIGEQLGDVRWNNFKVVDNVLAGIEMTYTAYSRPFATVQITNALVVGYTTGTSEIAGAIGLICPQTDGLLVQNVAFYNFVDVSNSLGDMSHSYSEPSRDTGARLTKLSGLSFTNANTLIAWGYPPTSFFEITDASLTGTAGAYVAAPWNHLVNPNCIYQAAFASIVCDGTVKIRRVEFYNLINPNNFFFVPATVKRLTGGDLPTTDNTTWSSIDMMVGGKNVSPTIAWSIPLALGFDYHIHWGSTPIDWTNLTIAIDQFEAPSECLTIHLNFTDVRQWFTVNRGEIPPGTDTSAPNFVDPTLIPLNTTALSCSMPAGSYSFDNVTNNETQIVLNGINSTIQNGPIQVNAYQCWGSHCNIVPVVANVTMENFTRVWSNNNSWTSGLVPQAQDSVIIQASWNMLLDTDTAILSQLIVLGNLTFVSNQSVTLSSYQIHIRGGVIQSGTASNPISSNYTHQIVIYGNYNSPAYAFDPNIVVVNKFLAVTGQLNLYGSPRPVWLHLVQNAKPGDTFLFVESSSNWTALDQIVVTSSYFNLNQTESFTIISVNRNGPNYSITSDSDWITKESQRLFGNYTSEVLNHTVVPSDPTNTMKIYLATPVLYYHAGTAIVVTNGNIVDTRAEVGLLTSNIIIRGDSSTNNWPCNIVVADFIDYDAGTTPVYRFGSVNLYNVVIDFCGQPSTERAGLRFQSNSQPSVVQNTVVKNSQTYSLYLTQAANVTLNNNFFYRAVRFGVVVMTATNTVLNGNLMAYTQQRVNVALDFDKPTAYLICPSAYTSCSSVYVINNVAAGYDFLGFDYGSFPCSLTSGNTFNNKAHSGVIGLIAEAFDPTCDQIDYFTAYFNQNAGVLGSQNAPEVRFNRIFSLENYIGFVGILGSTADTGNVAKVTNSVFGGKTVHSTCDPTRCTTDLGCTDRFGISTGSFGASQGFTFDGMLMLPLSQAEIISAFSGQFFFSNIYLGNFLNNQACSTQSFAITSNPDSPNFTPPSVFTNVVTENIPEGSLFYMYSPDPAWANLQDCNEFPCTAPLNVLVRDTDGSLSSNTTYTYLLPNNPGVAIGSDCTFVYQSNGYICKRNATQVFDYGLLYFDSQDVDASTRTFSPIYLTSQDGILSAANSQFYNMLNDFMDTQWDGFYTSQLRLSRFPSLIPLNRFINITATGVWATTMRYHLIGEDDLNLPAVITVNYTSPNTVSVYVNGTLIQPLAYVANDTNQVQISSPSGTNKWFYATRQIQFNIRPYDMIELIQIDSIQLSVRMNMTVEDFFASNGVTDFIDRLAASLSIPSYRIRVMDVVSGSTIVTSNLIANEQLSSSDQTNELNTLTASFITQVQNNTLVLNGPIISATVTNLTMAATSNTTSNTTTQPVVISPKEPSSTTVPSTTGETVDHSDSDDSDLPNWGIILVSVVGGFFVLVVAAITVFCLMRRRKLSNIEVIVTPAGNMDTVFEDDIEKGFRRAISLNSHDRSYMPQEREYLGVLAKQEEIDNEPRRANSLSSGNESFISQPEHSAMPLYRPSV